jgi:hypothetical protein
MRPQAPIDPESGAGSPQPEGAKPLESAKFAKGVPRTLPPIPAKLAWSVRHGACRMKPP